MTNWFDFTMLVCAAVGSMAFGILAAYGVLRGCFALLSPRRRPIAVEAQAEVARVS